MNIEIKYENKSLIAILKGELDHHSVSGVKEILQHEIEKEIAKNIVLDFTGIRFMDSSGIGMILGRFKEIQLKGGKMAISGMNQTVLKIFTLSGLQKIITSYDTIDRAIASLKEEK